MMLVKYAELTGDDSIFEWKNLGNFETTREVKECAWSHCSRDCKDRMYLCFEVEGGIINKQLHLVGVITLKKEHGCIRINDDTMLDTNKSLSADDIFNKFNKSIEIAGLKTIPEIEVAFLNKAESSEASPEEARFFEDATRDRRRGERRVRDRRG